MRPSVAGDTNMGSGAWDGRLRRDVVARYGTRMPTLINAVSATLTTGSLRSLNAQAVLDGRRPRSAAEAWLRAQGLM